MTMTRLRLLSVLLPALLFGIVNGEECTAVNTPEHVVDFAKFMADNPPPLTAVY